MKKFLLLNFLLISICSYSQTSYTSSNYASGNYSQQMTRVTRGILAFDFDTTGANITWDYSTLGIDQTKKAVTKSGSSTGFQAAYMAQCVLSGGGITCLFKWNQLVNIGIIDLDSLNLGVASIFDVTTLAKKQNNKLVGNIKGFKIKDSSGQTIPVVAEYEKTDTILNFPLNYLDTGKSYGAWGIDLSPIGQNIQAKITYVRNYKVEGWGTLITPSKTYNNVIKIKTVLDEIDSINFMGTKLGIPRKVVEYTWYEPTHGLPIMKAEGLEAFGFTVINSVEYRDNRSVGIVEKENSDKNNFSLFPNPTDNIITISNFSEKTITHYQVINLQGKIIKKNNFSPTLSMADLQSGVYFIQLISNNHTIGVEKFIKK